MGQRARVEELVAALQAARVRAGAIHGDMDQVGLRACFPVPCELVSTLLVFCRADHVRRRDPRHGPGGSITFEIHPLSLLDVFSI